MDHPRIPSKPTPTGIRLVSGCTAAVLVVSICLSNGAAQNRSALLVFVHVAVIDVVGGHVRPDMTVIVTGTRITAVAPSGKVRLPDANPLQDITSARRINAVVVNGRLLDRPALDSTLAAAQARAGAR